MFFFNDTATTEIYTLSLHDALPILRLVQAVPFEKLYWQPEVARARTFPVYSCGEHVLRSAAAVEQTFGGITVNLWDDPFEWTLPESLPAPSEDRKSTRLNSSHANISYAVFCLKKKKIHS